MQSNINANEKITEKQFWTTKDWYAYIMHETRKCMNSTEKNALEYTRQEVYDKLIENVIEESKQEINNETKKNLLLYVQQKQKIQLLKMIIYILLSIVVAIGLIFYFSDFMYSIVCITMIAIGVLIFNYVKIGKPTRNALMRACAK